MIIRKGQGRTTGRKPRFAKRAQRKRGGRRLENGWVSNDEQSRWSLTPKQPSGSFLREAKFSRRAAEERETGHRLLAVIGWMIPEGPDS